MGQRTQLYIIEHNTKSFSYRSKKLENFYEVSMYHNQWGYGYRQLLDVLAYILGNRTELNINKIFWNDGKNKNPTSINKSWLEKDITQKAPTGNLFDNIPQWRKFVNYGDNNNGIVVLELFRHYECINFGSIQCFRGDEDLKNNETEGEPITIKEFIEQYTERGLKKDKIYKMIKSFLDFYNIKEFNETKKVFYIVNGERKSLYLPKTTKEEEVFEYIADRNGGTPYGQTPKDFLQEQNIIIESEV